jgi:DNA-binding transcriptional regulator/RsmH inhibitor MraZ
MTDHPFIGNAYCAVDDAGRLTLPPFVRSALSRRSDARLIFVGCHDSDPCLIGYDRSFARTLAFDCRQQRLRSEMGAEGQWNARIRRAFGFVAQVELDMRGKVTLPPMMLRRARIGSGALVIGTGGAFEIWNPQQALDAGDPDLSELAAFHLDFRTAA